MTDITELAQSLKAAAVRAKTATEEYASGHMSVSVCYAECEEFNRLTDGPDNILALVEALEKAQQEIIALQQRHEVDPRTHEIIDLKERISELESNEVREEGNQFLVVRHPGKVPVIKHPVGELEDYLRQIFKADPLATIDIVTHRYYGVGGQFVEDADEYLHEMSIKVEAE
ncbi:hypothetical protein ACUV0W_000331 [Klebsiella pneumoniae]|uniref:hypothetical protein n=1 Tax=Klebsiella pneumoniae TaxID=573 RepID=UPI0027F1D47C|nr:hypothetical protein [Klebsiella pneumoniae]